MRIPSQGSAAIRAISRRSRYRIQDGGAFQVMPVDEIGVFGTRQSAPDGEGMRVSGHSV
jgi:hypothetical protein